jgi:hypothetical protein
LHQLDEQNRMQPPARQFVQAGTNNWLDTQVFSARLLTRLERHAEGIAVLDAALKLKPETAVNRAHLLAEKVVALHAAGRRDEALTGAEETRAVIGQAHVIWRLS